MAEKNGNNLRNGKFLFTALVSIIGAVGGAGSGSYLYFSNVAPTQLQSMVRPDPFTGSQARDLQAQISALRRAIDQLPPRELTERLALLEREVQLLRETMAAHVHP